MKTPMQELIEKLDKEINSKYPEGYNIVMEIAKDIAEEHLEKENFIIRQSYTYGYDDCGSKMPHDDKSFFNETFNTKEK